MEVLCGQNTQLMFNHHSAAVYCKSLLHIIPSLLLSSPVWPSSFLPPSPSPPLPNRFYALPWHVTALIPPTPTPQPPDVTQSSVIWCISWWCDMLSCRPRGENIFISDHSEATVYLAFQRATISKQRHSSEKADAHCELLPRFVLSQLGDRLHAKREDSKKSWWPNRGVSEFMCAESILYFSNLSSDTVTAGK